MAAVTLRARREMEADVGVRCVCGVLTSGTIPLRGTQNWLVFTCARAHFTHLATTCGGLIVRRVSRLSVESRCGMAT